MVNRVNGQYGPVTLFHPRLLPLLWVPGFYLHFPLLFLHFTLLLWLCANEGRTQPTTENEWEEWESDLDSETGESWGCGCHEGLTYELTGHLLTGTGLELGWIDWHLIGLVLMNWLTPELTNLEWGTICDWYTKLDEVHSIWLVLVLRLALLMLNWLVLGYDWTVWNLTAAINAVSWLGRKRPCVGEWKTTHSRSSSLRSWYCSCVRPFHSHRSFMVLTYYLLEENTGW